MANTTPGPRLTLDGLGRVLPIWVLLTLPLVYMAYMHFIVTRPGGWLFYWTGVVSVWFMFLTLAATPASRVFRGAGWARWLVQNRRYFGLAAFGYGLLHTLDWARQENLIGIVGSFTVPLILWGWIGFLIFVAMAITSNDYAVRRMGPGWKRLQRWVYLAAPLIVLHWVMAEAWYLNTALIYGGGLAVLMGLRWYVGRKRTG